MPQALLIAALWLHSLATVVLIGYYLLLSLIFLPYLGQALGEAAVGAALDSLSRRARTWLSIALLVFLVTGVYLMFVDANYLGVGRFGNAWSALMLAKHFLVLAVVGLWIWLSATLQRGLALSAEAHNALSAPLARARLIVHATSACGALVLLLTAAAQVQ